MVVDKNPKGNPVQWCAGWAKPLGRQNSPYLPSWGDRNDRFPCSRELKHGERIGKLTQNNEDAPLDVLAVKQ